MPWCFEWTVGLTFPRYLFMGVDAWFPARDDSDLPEVRRAFIPASLRRRLEKDHDLAAGYQQEASLGMVVGTPLFRATHHPDRHASWEPTITFTVRPRRRSKLRSKPSDRAAALADQPDDISRREEVHRRLLCQDQGSCRGPSFPAFTEHPHFRSHQPRRSHSLPDHRQPFTIALLPPAAAS